MSNAKAFVQSHHVTGHVAGRIVDVDGGMHHFVTLTSSGVKQEGTAVAKTFEQESLAWDAYADAYAAYIAAAPVGTVHWRMEPVCEWVTSQGFEVRSGYFIYSRLLVTDAQFLSNTASTPPKEIMKDKDTYRSPADRERGWRGPKGPNPLNTSGFRAAGHRVLLQPENVETVTESGIVLAAKTVKKEQDAAVMAVILEVGHDCWVDKSTDFAKVGDRVLVGQYTGKFHESPVDGKVYRFINDLDVISVIDIPSKSV